MLRGACAGVGSHSPHLCVDGKSPSPFVCDRVQRGVRVRGSDGVVARAVGVRPCLGADQEQLGPVCPRILDPLE